MVMGAMLTIPPDATRILKRRLQRLCTQLYTGSANRFVYAKETFSNSSSPNTG
jgi:hypothetical protein